jgi:SAM-dependent methyltransferase
VNVIADFPGALKDATQLFVDAAERARGLLPSEPGEVRRELLDAIAAVVDVAREIETKESRQRAREVQGAFRAAAGAVLMESSIMQRSISKPRGYAGDHVLLDAFYTRRTAEGPVGRLLDDLVLDCAAGRAVVDRKRYAARWLAERLERWPTAIVADIACGPCRLEKDVLDSGIADRARFVAMDGDDQALAYARGVVGADARVQLWHENALHIAREPQSAAPMAGADVVVSLGLFDYLPDRIAVRLLQALGSAMRVGGEIVVGNFADDNPSRLFMEWFGDWSLIHRTEREFLGLFEQAGFGRSEPRLEREAPGGNVLIVTARAGAVQRRFVSVPGRAAAAA